MRVIRRTENAKGMADRWRDVYCRNGNWLYDDGKRTIWEKLAALGTNPHPDDVDAAIGNGSWTECRCDECRGLFEEVVEVGQEPDYESATARICKGCLTMALDRLKLAV